MGYLSRLVVVSKGRTTYDVDGSGIERIFADRIATFELGKVYSVSDKLRKYKKTDCYYYADDGDTAVIEDACGDPLPEIPIVDAIRIIESEAKRDNYWRFAPCLALLKSFNETDMKLCVLHYGH